MKVLSLVSFLFISFVCVSYVSAEPSVEMIESLIQANPAVTLEEIVASMPADYRENYTLIYNSKSIQGASYQSPRAIVFGKNAKLIMAFNGEAS